MAEVRNDAVSSMDGQSGKSNNIQEGSLAQKSPVMMKIDAPEEDASSCKKEGNKAPYFTVTHNFSSSKPVFGGTGKLGSSDSASPRLGSPSFGGNPFAMKPTIFGSASKLGSGTSSSTPFGLSSSSPKPVFLRPSQLALGSSDSPQVSSRSIFPLKPPSLGNPFARVTIDGEITSVNETGKGEDSSPASSDASKPSTEEDGTNNSSHSTEVCKSGTLTGSVRSKDDKKGAVESNSQHLDNDNSNNSSPSSSGSQRSSKGIMAPPKFVPLGTPSRHVEESSSSCGNITSTNVTTAISTITTTTAATTSSTTSTSVTGFVFGQNLHERVAEAVTLEPTDTTNRTAETAGTSNNLSSLCTSATTNGTSEMLFTSVIKKDHNSESSHNSNNTNEIGDKPSKSLSEAAREYEEARAVKRKYEEVTIVTGEEDEANVLQMNCKLFAFDKTGGTWVERGRGTLRLNDKDSGPGGGGVQSRVVIRTTGSLRVVLNTKIWAGMSVDRPSPKSVRLTAMDNSGQIKVFLVMSSPKETEQLHKSLECRVILAQRTSSQHLAQNEAGRADGDLASHSLPPEPCSKKRLSQNVDDTSPSPDIAPV